MDLKKYDKTGWFPNFIIVEFFIGYHMIVINLIYK